jgi:glyoxylase-like metal-dependent hydrolase (beta-lactamase superfamily II)
MLKTAHFGPVTQFLMSTVLDGQPLYWVAAYLVDGLLIDTACANTAEELVQALSGSAAGLPPVRVAVNTHYHEDHVAANRLLSERLGVTILAHPWAIPRLRQVPPIPDYRATVWGRPVPSEALPVGDEIATERFHFRVVDTPGHCPGHVSLVEPDMGWCFTGDLFVGERPRVAWRETDVAEMIDSLERLAALASDQRPFVLFTAPGEVFENGRETLLACAGYLRDLVARGRELLADGLTEEAIRDALFDGESSFAALTHGEFSSGNLTRAVLAARTKAHGLTSPDGGGHGGP